MDHVLLALQETKDERDLRIRALFDFFDTANLGYLGYPLIETYCSLLLINLFFILSSFSSPCWITLYSHLTLSLSLSHMQWSTSIGGGGTKFWSQFGGSGCLNWYWQVWVSEGWFLWVCVDICLLCRWVMGLVWFVRWLLGLWLFLGRFLRWVWWFPKWVRWLLVHGGWMCFDMFANRNLWVDSLVDFCDRSHISKFVGWLVGLG